MLQVFYTLNICCYICYYILSLFLLHIATYLLFTCPGSLLLITRNIMNSMQKKQLYARKDMIKFRHKFTRDNHGCFHFTPCTHVGDMVLALCMLKMEHMLLSDVTLTIHPVSILFPTRNCFLCRLLIKSEIAFGSLILNYWTLKRLTGPLSIAREMLLLLLLLSINSFLSALVVMSCTSKKAQGLGIQGGFAGIYACASSLPG